MASAPLTRLRSGLPAVLLLLTPLLVSLHLMSSAVQNSATLSRLFVPLLLFNVVGLTVLLSLIVGNLVALVRQYRRREAGARLTARMVVIFGALSLLPVVVVYYYSLQFLLRGIDSWFDVQIDDAMEQVLELSRSALNLQQREHLKATERLMISLPEEADSPTQAVRLGELRRQSGATELALMDASGVIIASSNVNPASVIPDAPPETVLQQVRKGGSFVGMTAYGEDAVQHVRAVVGERVGRRFILQALFPSSSYLIDLGERVQEAYIRYRELAYLRESLKFSFALTLSLVLLLSFFAALWTAFYSARRLVAPIRDMAEGTRAVADGDFDTQLPQPRTQDELGFLVSSFNAMIRRLSAARTEAQESQRQVEAQREYLETVLGRLSSGVMTIDDARQLRTANAAASQILRTDLGAYVGRPFSALGGESPQLAQFTEDLEAPLAADRGEWREQITLYGSEGRQVLLCRGSPLPLGFGGHVLVFDDITNLVKAQRDAAWGEVARRLAHEIKNPLTPIQLSAERLRRKFLAAMGAEDAKVLDRATSTIVQQVEAMKEMVNAFSDYAKPSQINPVPLEVDVFVADVLELYRGPGGPPLEIELAAVGASIDADPVRLRQVVHNLVKNAQEAVAEQGDARIGVRTRRAVGGESDFVEIEVSDNGPGFAEANLGQIFEPYVTTKTKGTGLGLAIVKKIIEEHGGIIWAANGPSGGGCMTIRLPARGVRLEGAASIPPPVQHRQPQPVPATEETQRHDRTVHSRGG